MTLLIDAIPVPLKMDEAGTIRVGGTRVTLDTIIIAYQQGDTPEVIAEGFPTVSRADIYAVISYYLRHQEEVDAYLERQEQEANQIRQKIEALCPPDEFRRRISARRKTNDLQ